jgi:plastocyanin
MRVHLLLASVGLAAACGGSDSSPTPPVTPPAATNKAVDVFTVGTSFSPNFVQITAGDTVRFNFAPTSLGEGHDVTFDAKAGAPANIPVTKLRIVVAKVFTTRGTFHYNCFVHPGMSGDVVVQ